MLSPRPAEAHYQVLEEHRAAQPLAPADEDPVEEAEPDPVERAPDRPATPNYWTLFRGPRMDGHYDEMVVRTDWPAEGLPLLWKQPIGGGYASFVIADGRAITIEQRRDEEAVVAYDVASGRELWLHGWKAAFREAMGGDGPRATPTWHEGKVYALGASGELRVLEAATGELVWERDILRDNGAGNLQWGMASSPLIVDEKVIVLPGGARASVVAYHRLTGEPVWRTLDDPQAYTSPMLVSLAGERQILTVSRRRAMGLRPEDGALLWDYPWVTDHGVNAAQPLVVGEDRFVLSAGYGHGAVLVQVERQGSGFAARTVWENKRMKNKFGSSVLHEGHVYGLDEAILACIDAKTGDLKWKGGRYGHGQLLLASAHLVVLTEKGDLVLVRATPERHVELARFNALEGKTWNHPALAGGLLLVRNATQMAAFRLSGG
jgi:outer membrane protein assembly factor BamB